MWCDRTAEYRRGNTEAAAIILAGDPQTFGAGLVRWAEMCMSTHGSHHAPVVRGAGQARKPEQLALGFEASEQVEAW